MIHSNHVNFMVLIMVVHGKRSKGVKKKRSMQHRFPEKSRSLRMKSATLFSRQLIG